MSKRCAAASLLLPFIMIGFVMALIGPHFIRQFEAAPTKTVPSSR